MMGKELAKTGYVTLDLDRLYKGFLSAALWLIAGFLAGLLALRSPLCQRHCPTERERCSDTRGRYCACQLH